jgi:IclR family transcriptional regulator, KDG regulon repressor
MKPATTVTKVCRVLGEFRTRSSLGVSDLARRTDLLPSDVHRILASLQTCGYVEQDLRTRTYRPGVGLLKLGLTTVQRTELREAGTPLLKRLADELEATTHMAMFDSRELEVFLVEQIDSPGHVVIKSRLGLPVAPHCTALGKTIMACLTPELRLSAMKKSGMPRNTENTITDVAALERELICIRDQGYALDREESVLGACCIAAPVYDRRGAPIASVSASMAAGRFYAWSQPHLASLLEATAADLSALLGYRNTTQPVLSPDTYCEV